MTNPPTHTELPVVKGFTNARGVHVALTEPYVPFERAPVIQSIIALFVQWREDAIDESKPDMPKAFEKLDATDIAYIDYAKLHDVNYKGKPLGKKHLAELLPFERSQRRSESLEYGSATHSPLETPFIDSNQRKVIQDMFPVDDYPFADVARIQLRGKRNANFQSLIVIEPDVTAATQLSHFLMQSSVK